MKIWPLQNAPQLPPAALYVYNKIVEAGHDCLFAGGWVRDLWLGTPSHDLDLATSATPQQILDLFPRTLALGKRFGTVAVLVSEPQQAATQTIEVTSFRSEGEYLDGRRPSSISFTSASIDAQRRDFTINGLFYRPKEQQIIDYVGGIDDLNRKLIRAIGEPKQRFQEDRLRALRAVRFATRLGFALEPATRQAIIDSAASLPECVSAERIYQELKKMYQLGHLAEGLMMMLELGLVHSIFGCTAQALALQKRLKAYLELAPSSQLVSMLALLWPLREGRIDPACEPALLRLKISNEEKRRLVALTQICERYQLDPKIDQPVVWLQWLKEAAFEDSPAWLFAQTHDGDWRARWQRWCGQHCLAPLCKAKQSLFYAKDLKALALKPGRPVGRLLDWLFQEAAKLNVCNKELLISHLRAHPVGAELLSQARQSAEVI